MSSAGVEVNLATVSTFHGRPARCQCRGVAGRRSAGLAGQQEAVEELRDFMRDVWGGRRRRAGESTVAHSPELKKQGRGLAARRRRWDWEMGGRLGAQIP